MKNCSQGLLRHNVWIFGMNMVLVFSVCLLLRAGALICVRLWETTGIWNKWIVITQTSLVIDGILLLSLSSLYSQQYRINSRFLPDLSFVQLQYFWSWQSSRLVWVKAMVNVLKFRIPKCLTKWHANSADPDQTAPSGAVWSGSTLFAIPLSILRNCCI